MSPNNLCGKQNILLWERCGFDKMQKHKTTFCTVQAVRTWYHCSFSHNRPNYQVTVYTAYCVAAQTQICRSWMSCDVCKTWAKKMQGHNECLLKCFRESTLSTPRKIKSAQREAAYLPLIQLFHPSGDKKKRRRMKIRIKGNNNIFSIFIQIHQMKKSCFVFPQCRGLLQTAPSKENSPWARCLL